MTARKALVVSYILVFFGAAVFAQSYKVALAQLATTAAYSDFLKALATQSGLTFDISVMPRARVYYELENKQVDIGLPITDIRNPKKQGDLKFDYSILIYKVAYVLYTNKGKAITAEELKSGNPRKYKIEVDNAFVDGYEFQTSGSSSPEASLQKVDNGTIDGFIFSEPTGDPLLKKAALKNVKRQLYSYYNVYLGVQQGGAGGDLDKRLSGGLAKLKASGEFDTTLGGLVKEGGLYSDWQQ